MITFLHGYQLENHCALRHSMFRDRSRLLSSDCVPTNNISRIRDDGDEVDRLNPLYVIATSGPDVHLGSLRLMPKKGNSAFNDCQCSLVEQHQPNRFISLECSRFCIPSSAQKTLILRLMAGAAFAALQLKIQTFYMTVDAPLDCALRKAGLLSESKLDVRESKSLPRIASWKFDSEHFRSLSKRARIDERDLRSAYYCTDEILVSA